MASRWQESGASLSESVEDQSAVFDDVMRRKEALSAREMKGKEPSLANQQQEMPELVDAQTSSDDSSSFCGSESDQEYEDAFAKAAREAEDKDISFGKGGEKLKSSFLGTVTSNMFVLFVKKKFEYCDNVAVSIGGTSMQLLKGRTTGFRMQVKNFCFEGSKNSEAEFFTISSPDPICFSVGRASHGGKFFDKRVPAIMRVKTSEEDATESIRADKGNIVLRTTLQECWNHMHDLPPPPPPASIVKDSSKRQTQPGADSLPIPDFKVKFQNGLALYTAQNREGGEPLTMALSFHVEEIDGQEQVVLREEEWPEAEVATNATCGPKSRQSGKWRKVMDLPADIRFKSVTVEGGCFSFCYTFLLDL